MNKTLNSFSFRFFIGLMLSGLLLAPLNGYAQSNATQKYTLSGYIKDASSGETLPGASVFLVEDPVKGTSTNVYGFYSLTLPAGKYIIGASFIGYDAQQFEVDLSSDDLSLNIDLSTAGIQLEGVEIRATRKDNVESTDMGKVELQVEKIKKLPALMGEVDVVRTLQLLPGVMSSGEVNSGLYVRGGGPDQNLVLLDEAVVYNTGHLFGFFSVFNSDAIKSTNLQKGTMPAEYGGRLSSVLDVTMKEGNNQRFQADGGIGIISSRLTLQGPIQKNKSSFLVSGRRTYADAIAKPFLKGTDFEGNGYYFYDLNAKANYIFSDKDRIFLSGYFGRDVFNFRSADGFGFDMPWGNATATLRWNHLFNDKLFMNTTAIFNQYDFGAIASFNDFSSEFSSGVEDWNGKIDFDYFPNPNHKIKFGANYTYHTFTPYFLEAQIGDTEINSDDRIRQRANEAAIYIQDDMSITDDFQIHVGLRASAFQQVGPYTTPELNEQGVVVDTLNYERGDVIASYGGIEPRFAARYKVGVDGAIKASAIMTNQYIHLVSNSGVTLPIDLWVPSSAKVKPQRGIQYSAGYFRNFLNDQFEASVEVYYKNMNNQIEYSEDYVPELGEPVENSFVFGKGRSYGMELFLKKRTGKFNGWVGYTLSRTVREFPDINDGRIFPATFDRTHDLSVVTSYDIHPRWTLSAVFVYGTGQTLTLPNSFVIIENYPHVEYGDRNSYRLPAYHRLDFSAVYRISKENARFYNDLNISIYNVYNNYNPFFVYASPDVPTTTQTADDLTNTLNWGFDMNLKQVSLFPIVPSITWNFSF